ncbi:transforming growth factor beta activator LRRC32 [Pimephales promelas]|uniref:transforming growth factor beta activator LRRC32 n=1 Tax=Pimephales promelas TaxID=90988 RepID=UPI001955F390|nr:transforming growth factor beta activator LRRC32 [Pimephales promelas]KAG1927544.1 transforming growth factor beta activator LRRC33 [Pimephales promelas]
MGPCVWILVLVVQPVLAFRRPPPASACRELQEDLDCSNLNLRRIPKQIPDTILRLDLSRNLLQNLTDRDLPSSSTIRHLNLHGNKIQFIQPGLFRDTSLLEELDLSENSLDLYASLKTHVGTLTSVRRLDLSGNGLFTDMSDFFLNDAPVLTNLSLSGNSITKIGRSTFNGSRALKSIDLNNNVIIEIEEGAFESLTGLSDLDLSMNSISCITDFNLVRLKTLNLSKNSLTNFQADDSAQEFELQYLDLRENKILYFPVLPQRNKLVYLDLSRNLLRSVNCSGPLEELENLKESGYLMTDPDKPLSLCVNKRHQDFPSLLYLDLSFNQLKAVPSSFFSSMTALETLNISYNCLESFTVDDDGLNSLETLDISSNNLQNLSFGLNALAALHELRLGGNALQTLDAGIFLRLPSIRSLHLQQNQLSICSPSENPSFGCVQLSSIPTLRYLYLSENGLFSVPPGSLQGSPLLILDLSQNPGVDVIPASFSGLEASLSHLSLKGNQLQSLTIDFTVFPNLKSLDLSVNRLTGVSLWSGDSSLESLNLQNNSLVSLYEVTLQESLRTLYVGSNPLSCCMNPHLLALLRQERLTVPDLSGATCWYSRDSERVEIGVSAVKPEHCESADGKVLWISVIVALALGMALVLAVTIKLCHSKRNRFKRGFKA